MKKKYHHPWTYKELDELRKLRESGATFEACAFTLGRTYNAVRQAAFRLKIKRNPRGNKDEIMQRIRFLVKEGYNDAKIAILIKRTRFTVATYRKRMKLEANQIRKIKVRPRCSNCNKIAPILPGPDWAKFLGWEVSSVAELDNVIVIRCKECIIKHGSIGNVRNPLCDVDRTQRERSPYVPKVVKLFE